MIVSLALHFLHNLKRLEIAKVSFKWHAKNSVRQTYSQNFTSIILQQPFVVACGSHSTLDAQSARIIGGNDAVGTQWPSVALLYDKKRNLQCTTSILTPLWVIASYSCVVGADNTVTPLDWTLYAGGTNFFSETNNTSTQSKNVETIITFPQVKHYSFNKLQTANCKLHCWCVSSPLNPTNP